jgi:hypothetical protein
MIWVVLVYIVFLAGAITSFGGGNLLAASIGFIKISTVGILQNTFDILMAVRPAINQAFDGINDAVQTVLNILINALNLDGLTDLGVFSNLNAVADNLDAINTNVVAIRTAGEGVVDSKAALLISLATLSTGNFILIQL